MFRLKTTLAGLAIILTTSAACISASSLHEANTSLNSSGAQVKTDYTHLERYAIRSQMSFFSYQLHGNEDLPTRTFSNGDICFTTHPHSDYKYELTVELIKDNIWPFNDSKGSITIPTGQKKTVRWNGNNLWEGEYFIRLKPSSTPIWDTKASVFNC